MIKNITKKKKLSIGIILILIPITLLFVVVFLIPREDKFREYKIHPIENIKEEPGGPDYYEGVCITETTVTRDELGVYQHVYDNNIVKLETEVRSINPELDIEIRELEYSEETDSENMGVFIIRNRDLWKKTNDENKLTYLTKFSEIFMDNIHENIAKSEFNSILFYTCDKDMRSQWTAFIGINSSGIAKIRFDWK